MTFKPGQSGNPGGRPKGLAARARELGDRALDVIREGLDDPDPKVKLAAAKEVFDRGWGKPVQMTADITKRLDEFSDDDLDAGISALRAALSAAGEDGERAAKATKH